jgi:hypothetical protein
MNKVIAEAAFIGLKELNAPWQKFYKENSGANFNFKSKNDVESQLDKVISSSPHFLKIAIINGSLIEKSITMFSSSIVAGSLFPNAWFNYDNKRNSPALYALIVFPASSGKGAATMSRKLLGKINDSILNEYNVSLSIYKEVLREYRKNPTGVPPEKPKLKLVMAPGNTSSAKLIELLSDLDGEEILTLFETEMDAVGIASNGEFGSMNSSIFRQAFHHEPISKMIKRDGEVQIANNPKLSIVLTGTINQVHKLLHSNADGLVSRFLVLLGDAELIWKNTQPCSECPVLDDQFDEIGKKYLEIWKHMKTKNVEIKFTQSQWDAIQEFGRYHLMNAYHFSGESAASLPKRHALMICRLATIFTMFRYYEQKNEAAEVYCTDVDFGNALWMIEYSLFCGLELFKSLPGEIEETARVEKKMLFINALPAEFITDDTITLINKFSISERTISRWLKEFVEAGFLERVKPGLFRKTAMATMAMATIAD